MSSYNSEKSTVGKVVEDIDNLLHEYACEKSARAVRWYRVRQSVRFWLPVPPELRADVEFRKGEPQIYQEPTLGSSDKIICFVPFFVEKVGDNEFIARD